MSQSPPVAAEDGSRRGESAKNAEPRGLIEQRQEFDLDRIAYPVPHAVGVGGDDAKNVVAGGQVGVIGHAAVACVDPIGVEPFELVTEAHILRRGEAQGGEGELQLPLAWIQDEGF